MLSHSGHCAFLLIGVAKIASASIVSNDNKNWIHHHLNASQSFLSPANRIVSSHGGNSRFLLVDVARDLGEKFEVSHAGRSGDHSHAHARTHAPKRQLLWIVTGIVNGVSILLLMVLGMCMQMGQTPRHLGYPLAIVAACNQAAQNLTLHVASREGLTSGESYFWRSVLCTFLPITICWCNGYEIFPRKNIGWLFLRGLLGSAGVYGIFLCVSLIPLSHATAIYATFPFWTGLFALCVFKEEVRCITGTLMLISFVGVLFILQPFDFFHDFIHEPHMWAGIVAGILGAMFSAMAAIVIHYLGEDTPRMVVVAWFGMVGLLISPIFMLVEGGFLKYTRQCFQESLVELWPVVVISMSALLLQLCYTWALQIARAGPITSVFQFIELTFQWSLAAWLLGEVLTWWIIAGVILVVASSVALYFSERGIEDGWIPKSWQSPLPRAAVIIIR